MPTRFSTRSFKDDRGVTISQTVEYLDFSNLDNNDPLQDLAENHRRLTGHDKQYIFEKVKLTNNHREVIDRLLRCDDCDPMSRFDL